MSIVRYPPCLLNLTRNTCMITLGVCLVAQSCLTLCDPMDCSPPGSSVLGISQVRILEWVAISSSRGSSWPRDQTILSCIGRWILYHWANREAQFSRLSNYKVWRNHYYYCILLSMVVQLLLVILGLSQEEIDKHMSFYSTILNQSLNHKNSFC